MEGTRAVQISVLHQLAHRYSDLNAWDAWSPWAGMDPSATYQVEGSGVGQTMSWSSEDPRVGSGTQAIASLIEPQFMETHLDFGSNGQAESTFQLVPEDGKTRVAWSLDTDVRAGVPLLKQPLSTFFGLQMDRMVGSDYEVGLANLKRLAEG
jgi:hypothetical protein